MFRKIAFVFAGLIFGLFACEDEPDDIVECPSNPVDTTTLVSYYGGTLSHNAGDNCQACHTDGSTVKGWFNAAGTVYDSTQNKTYPNATINLYDGIQATGNLVATVEADSLGNFYTTEDIEFGVGLYIEVIGDSSSAQMGARITSGACNKCHGVITNRIWVK